VNPIRSSEFSTKENDVGKGKIVQHLRAKTGGWPPTEEKRKLGGEGFQGERKGENIANVHRDWSAHVTEKENRRGGFLGHLKV